MTLYRAKRLHSLELIANMVNPSWECWNTPLPFLDEKRVITLSCYSRRLIDYPESLDILDESNPYLYSQ